MEGWFATAPEPTRADRTRIRKIQIKKLESPIKDSSFLAIMPGL